jgi:hypothetical protein
MTPSKKRRGEDKTPSSPPGRSPRRKKLRRHDNPPPPVFSGDTSDDVDRTSASSYRVVYEDDSSAPPTPTFEERMQAAKARCARTKASLLLAAPRPRSRPVVADAGRARCFDDAASCQVVSEDDSSEPSTPTFEERMKAAQARCARTKASLLHAPRRQLPRMVVADAGRAPCFEDPASSSSEDTHVEDRRAAAKARFAASAESYRDHMAEVDALRANAGVGTVYTVPVRSSATVLGDSSESSDADTDPGPRTPPSFASLQVKTTCRPKCLAPFNIARRARYAQLKLLANARSTSNEKLLHESLQTKVGAKALPALAKGMGTHKHHAALAENAAKLMSLTGGRHRQEVAHLLTNGLPASWCREELGLSKAAAKRATEALRNRTPSQVALDESRSCANARYAEGTDRTSRNFVSDGETMAYDTFFHRTTHQCSGADVARSRILDREYFTWEADLSAQWPGILRELAGAHPHLLPDLAAIPKTGWTKFQASMLAAVHGCPDDPTKERTLRHAKSVAVHCRRLATKAGRLPPWTIMEKEVALEKQRAVIQSRLTASAFDPTKYEVTAPTMPAFREWLKWRGYRYTRYTVPHPCPLCDAGPVDELVFAELRIQETALKLANEPVPGELAQRITNLRKKNRLYRVHLDQLRECRAAVQKTEKELTPGTAMIIRDFVNHHDHGGKHVKCLHWVLTWRDKDTGELRRLKLRHYCSDKDTLSCDSYFQADVTDFHLAMDNSSCPGLMEQFHTLIFVGDHGPHFSSHETVHNESTILRRYGKVIKLMFLASYHAYSRADGSGAEDSSDLRRDFLAGLPRNGAADMTDMTNESNDQCSWAYMFPAINRRIGLFPAHKHFSATDRAKWIRKWTEVTFNHPAPLQQYDGIVQYRLVTGVGPWRWTDLIAASRGPTDTMCDSCSTNEMKIVYHLQMDCPKPDYIHDLPVFKDLLPDAARITGLQQRKESKSGAKKAITFPCKIVTCDKHTNKRKALRSAKTANDHMRTKHELTTAQYTELAYPDDAPPPAASDAQHPRKRGRPRKDSAQSVQDASEKTQASIQHDLDDNNPELQPGSARGPQDIMGNVDELQENSDHLQPDPRIRNVENPATPQKPARPVKPKPKGAAPKKSKRPAKNARSDSESPSDSESTEESTSASESGDDQGDDDDPDADDDQEDDPDAVVEKGKGKKQYEVEAIKKHKLKQDGTYKYLVKWTGYKDASWEDQRRLGGAEDLRAEYHQGIEDEERRAASAHAVAGALQNVKGRTRRLRGQKTAGTKSDRVNELKIRTAQLESTGLTYWKAHAKAQQELGVL